MRAQQILVSGDVHGVGYRMWCRRTARALGLRGFVRNLSDGRVEVFAEGDELALASLGEQCRRGPVAATVSDVAVGAREPRGLAGFEVAYDADAPEPA